MNARSGIAVMVAAFGVLATVTSCSSSTKAASTPSPNAAAISNYLNGLRSVAAIPQPDAQRFSPKQSSDSQLIAVGEEACADLQDHKPADVVGLLKQKGWPQADAAEIIIGAAASDTLCPGQYQAVKDWIHSTVGG